MRICFAASECVPFVKTGGLADVVGALPRELAKLGCEVKVFLPLYSSIHTLDHGLIFSTEFHNTPLSVGDKTLRFNVWYLKDDSGVEYHFIDCPYYYHRAKVYTDDADEDERFIFFQDALLAVLQRLGWAPDVLHCNDWQTALLPVFLKEKYRWDSLFAGTASVLSIHNIGYQGRFSERTIYKAGLQYDNYYPGGPFEFYDSFCMLKAGILYADIVSTVSETYAKEIQTPAYGEGMEGVLASRGGDLRGILNGIDVTVWNPARDRHIPATYTFETLENKKTSRRALLEFAHLPYDEDIPVVGMISRLAIQKGFDLLMPVFNELLELPVQFVILGSGERKYEEFLRWASHTYQGRAYAHIGFDGALAHLITAGTDLFLMPSRYEPCGLNQMYCLNYGTIPIVRKTGGLADTVRDYHEFAGRGNGISFYDFSPYALGVTVQRAVDLFRQETARLEMIERGMCEDFSWENSAKKYLELYAHARQLRG